MPSPAELEDYLASDDKIEKAEGSATHSRAPDCNSNVCPWRCGFEGSLLWRFLDPDAAAFCRCVPSEHPTVGLVGDDHEPFDEEFRPHIRSLGVCLVVFAIHGFDSATLCELPVLNQRC